MQRQLIDKLGLLRPACASLVLLGAVTAQWQPTRTIPKPIDFATSQNDNLFSLTRSQDDIYLLETAIAELADGEHDAAVRRLHELLRIDPVGVVPIAPGRYLGTRAAVVAVLANLSPAARARYEDFARREAGALMSSPINRLSPQQLARLAERFPTTARGQDARLLLGDRALERGDGLTASTHFRAALDASEIGSTAERRAIDRIEVARVLVDPVTALTETSGTKLSDAARAVLPSVVPPAPGRTAINGGRSGRTPMDAPIGNPIAFWRSEIRAPGFERRIKGDLALFPVGDLESVFIATGQKLIALDPLSRSIRWESVSPLRDFDQDQWNQDEDGDRRRTRRRFRSSPSDTINQDMVLAAAVSDDVVVCALQVPDDGANVDFQGGYRIISKIPQRRLFAFSKQTGKILWRHFDELDGPLTRRFRGQDSCGPPVIAGDTVYAPVYDRSGAIAFSVAAYELATGRLKWRRLVCSSQQDVNMFGNARMEFAASPLALHRGAIYGSTNLGVAYAVDAGSGRVRWITSYDVVRMPRAMLHGQPERQVFFSNNAPVLADGVVCMTPLDSQFALGMDAESGDVLWRLPYDARVGTAENRVQWLCGAIFDEFILSGAGVVAVKARPDIDFDGRASARQVVHPELIAAIRRSRLPARPAVTADHIFIPSDNGVLAFDGNGAPHRSLPNIPVNGYQPGNLMLVDGAICSLRSRAFDFLIDTGALLERSNARIAAAPDDPEALLQLAKLQRSLLGEEANLAQQDEIQQLFQRGLEACVEAGLPEEHPTRAALQSELYAQALKIAQSAVDRSAADASDLLAAARDLAPDTDRWIAVQSQLLANCREDRPRFLAELEALERRAPAGTMPAPLMMRVPAFVLWQRALVAEAGAEAALLWQQLLENHGQEQIGRISASSVAEGALTALISSQGRAVYASIERRAEAALDAAEDDDGLRGVTASFPNSAAAERAGLLLLDRAVAKGDLGAACSVMARAIRNDRQTPGLLRRLQVAALARGNRPLAGAVAERLDQAGDAPSNWQGDEGETFAEASRRALAASPPLPAARLYAVPRREISTITPRSRQEYIRMVPNRIADGFGRPADAPVYVVAGSELVAYDVAARAGKVLFSVPVEFLEHIIICGETVVVPDMERLFAVDYRTGDLRWELEFERPRLIESLGVTRGVLHVSAQPAVPDGNSELLGVEPLTGTQLFQRSLSEQHLKPKPVGQQLLSMAVTDEGVFIERLDAVTGGVLARIACAAALGPGMLQLRADSLATRLYPQGMAGDARLIYLPVDGRKQDATSPQMLALDDAGKLVWRWQGTAGMSLLMAQRRGDKIVIAETNDQRTGRMLSLRAADGAELDEVDIGYDAAVLNWERSWLHNPAPAIVAVGSEMERQLHQRQLVCFAVDADQSFAVPLRPTDGDVERAPLFGEDFVTFGVRPKRAGAPFRLYAIDLQTRRGAFTGSTSSRPVRSRGVPHGMTGAGPYTVLATTQGLIVMGDQPQQEK